MLVLTRKRNEMITIGSDIVIRVIKISNTSVRIGIEAPACVRVLRGELAKNEVHESVVDLDISEGGQFEECLLEAMLMQN